MIAPCVLWCDGGGDTGLAWYIAASNQFFAWEYKFDTAADWIEETCRNWGPALAIGWERYTIRPDKPQTDAYDPIGINQVAGWMARRHRCQILKPAQQHTPTRAEHHELEAIGWWVPGKDDAQSAACHMLRWMRRSGNLPPRVAAQLSEAAGTI